MTRQAGTTASARAARTARWADSLRRIVPLAWPVFIGQVSVLAFATIDTLLVARAGANDLAALAVGSAAYITVFIGFMGVLMALAPIVGQLHGAGRDAEAGHEVHQALWIAFALALLGSTLLVFPAPFLALAQASPEVGEKVRGYLLALAFSLPASLLFTVYRAFNTAVSRPKAVMVLQLGGLALKVPLSTALVFGVPSIGLPALGVTGCGIATALAMWAQALAAFMLVRRDPYYQRFALTGHGLHRPERARLLAMLRLGVPMGAAILVEVTGFAFMAIFIARLGTTPVAGHQIVVNMVSLLFMMPLALANATGTLVAQRIGAGDHADARRLGWHGLALGCAIAAVMGAAVYVLRAPVLGLYSQDAAVLAAALPLVAWLAVFHVADAAQTIAAFVLRAYKIATVPVLIYVAALWGVGLGGGYQLAFNVSGQVPVALQGAPGYWVAATAGLVVAGVALSAFMLWMMRQQRDAQQAAPA
ncbi:MATE family efflux transporter [Rubrivivax rivuli]|uniref:Multidrug-efflux transporter n=1 Tax=Rubrivivax rivuli TaxID=1862385 RepID=A0A437RE39_9BURK|nr:MATE family efflux transporter [Rubrivivax rivuli]RVU45018.1 MATE family efflux transporter [Rubrivivax rivuli]